MRHRREILAIALPAIVSNITTPILGLVDVAVTGHIGPASYIGAIALGGTVFNMLYWLFNFLRMGSSGLTAQAYGRNDGRAVALVFYRSLLVALAVSAIMILAGEFYAPAALRFMDADDGASALALRYFRICIWGAPAVLATYALSGWFLGMQNSRVPMWTALITNIVNIVVSVTLVSGFGWTIEGVATGTLTSQWIGAAVALVVALRKFKPHFPSWAELLRLRELGAFFRINADIFLRTACLVAVTVWFTRAGASLGVDILAGNALLLQLFMLFSFFIDGFAFAGEALAGKYYGMGWKDELRSLVSGLLRVGMVCALVFSSVYFVAGETVMGLLAEDASVVSTAVRFLPWAVVIPLCGFCAFVMDGVLVGLTATGRMLAAMFTSMLVFFAVYFLLRDTLHNHALWLAFDSYLMTRGLVELLLSRKCVLKGEK